MKEFTTTIGGAESARTIFMLAGGNDRKVNDYGQKLCDVVSKYISKPSILSCFFASPEDTWKERATGFSGLYQQPGYYNATRRTIHII